MTITINNKEYLIKYSIRAFLIYEQITGKQFSLNTLTDQYLYLFCLIMAKNPDIDFSFDELIDYCDEDPTIMEQFAKFLVDDAKRRGLLPEDEAKDDKKKV